MKRISIIFLVFIIANLKSFSITNDWKEKYVVVNDSIKSKEFNLILVGGAGIAFFGGFHPYFGSHIIIGEKSLY